MALANPPLGQILIATMGALDQGPFPVNYTPRNRPRYSVPRLIYALLTHAHDANLLASDLWKEFDNVFVAGTQGRPFKRDILKIWNDQVLSANQRSTELANAVHSRPRVQRILINWAEEMFNDFLLPMRQRSHTPTPETGSSGRSGSDAFRTRHFHRDGPVCLLTGKISKDISDEDLQRVLPLPGNVPASFITLEGAHIIPYSVSKRPKALRLLRMFQSNISIDEKSINDARNGMMMQHDTHDTFDDYKIGIEPQTRPDGTIAYVLRLLSQRLPSELQGKDGMHLQFGAWQQRYFPNKQYELPDPELLRTHLAIGRVLHASGAAEVVDQILREEEDMKQTVGSLSGVTTGNMDREEGSEPWDSIALRYVDRSLSNFVSSSTT
jgi:hypothetical protein